MKAVCSPRRVWWRAALVVLLAGSGAGVDAKMAVDLPTYNFGFVANDSQVLHDFVIRNTGDNTLEIRRVVSECEACLTANIEKMKIPPGGTSVLHCRLDLRSLSGRVSRTVSVDGDDSREGPLVLELRGEVVSAYRVSPPAIGLDLSQGQQ